MKNFITELCSVTFMPHGQCYLWNPWLVWLHVVADGLIALAYFSIPITIFYFVRRRPGQPMLSVFLMFGFFIVACGLTHLLAIWTIWEPHYWVAGGMKAITAVVSIITAITLVRLMPMARTLPSAAELKRLNESLEARVSARTSELTAVNEQLQREVVQREQGEREIRRLNEVLQRRLAELQSLFHLLPVGVGIASDGGGKEISMNPALAAMLGLEPQRNASLTSPDEVVPRNFRVVQNGRELRPEELPMQRALGENQSILDFEETIVRDDGVVLQVLANAVPLRDAEGRVRGCVATFQDVTLLKAASEADARYAAIIASSEDAIVGKTLAGVVTSWNRGAERLFGYSAEEMLNQPISRIFPEDRLQEEAAILKQILRGEVVPQFETVRRRKDGRLVDVSIIISPIHDGSGRIIGASKSARDISDRKRAAEEKLAFERKLLETQKLESLGVLAGGIAHDFNNILTGILGNASLASLDMPVGAPAQSYLESIKRGSLRAADLCKQMLAYSGKGRFIVQNLDLNVIVEETTHMLQISISKQAVLRFNFYPGLPAIEADATQIRQVVMNLVINASEAIGEKSGVISLATGLTRVDRAYLGGTLLAPELPEGTYVYLEVSDTGCGMSQETQAKIFDPFFTTKFTGRGLGLAAVLGIVRGHHGALKIYSEEGRGTTFKLLFPSVTGAVTGAPERIAMERWRGAGCVLVVDDEESVRSTAALMLQKQGFEVALAADGREAVAAFRAQPDRYALVLMDLTMPHLDGEQTFAELRRISPDVRVVLMSGFSEQEAVARFTGKGLAGFLQKPFQFEALSEALQRVLGGK